ncbi:hypothetical protein [Photobacterium ganghwense]|uniref:hypothetical protein n=1 Tax=Photobacterium ganghwense TaxID=320778 RepID=UPI001A8DD658|nr:hypothetical protein [Photobacterium ganghwense]QSV17303.1 hypothetical protein FH974_20460 [Photobacterium ganghwense]
MQSTLQALEVRNSKIIDVLDTQSDTSSIKAIQVIQTQKVILAVGAFSIFEAYVQDIFSCKDGFKVANKTLVDLGELELKERFDDFYLAINVLKHGKGRSYEALLKKKEQLPFRVKEYDESFFDEGDVSEIMVLIDVDDDFVRGCAEIINKVSTVINIAHTDLCK